MLELLFFPRGYETIITSFEVNTYPCDDDRTWMNIGLYLYVKPFVVVL